VYKVRLIISDILNGTPIDTLRIEWGGRVVFTVTAINADSVATDCSLIGPWKYWAKFNDNTRASTTAFFLQEQETVTYHFRAYAQVPIIKQTTLNDSTFKIWAKIPCLECEVDSAFVMKNYKVQQKIN